ncbi:hypothetical protein Leryth_026842 [Lithospermum erythrorhizon]|nr:hypothetical protein Leryth_026842 [Lithospermum erythrorhizon]
MDTQDASVGYLIPKAEELESYYYKSALKWVDDNSRTNEIPVASVSKPVDEDNTLSFLIVTSTFKKMDTK